ncbi:hypothetical protein FA15DRAFT_711884 [Coprinopsis marcescibilis]|uniref:Uncharacterized protein n=1 Tax=Coprinopsis marcescibilis TaxID=230819 RepID=A0A5C3K929_COPMA|nr:hypothetical protein FA15DRAFT_711884 [Coprinopsis marcescibilis]
MSTMPSKPRQLEDISSAYRTPRKTRQRSKQLICCIQARDFGTSSSKPAILHWDLEHNDLREWAWPSNPKTGTRIPPSELWEYRRTHYFHAPNCLCVYALGTPCAEARIGMVVVPAHEPGPAHPLNGEYIAECTEKHCGYFINLERFYACPVLLVKKYLKREVPLKWGAAELTHINDIGKADTQGELDLLCESVPVSKVVKVCQLDLRTETPTMISQGIRKSFVTLYTRGIPEGEFWNLFIQCGQCRMIIPKDVFFQVHDQKDCCSRQVDGASKRSSNTKNWVEQALTSRINQALRGEVDSDADEGGLYSKSGNTEIVELDS